MFHRRAKGRDWYDLVWYVGHHPQLRSAIANLDVGQVRQEMDRCVKDTSSLTLWSREFFLQIAERIETV